MCSTAVHYNCGCGEEYQLTTEGGRKRKLAAEVFGEELIEYGLVTEVIDSGNIKIKYQYQEAGIRLEARTRINGQVRGGNNIRRKT